MYIRQQRLICWITYMFGFFLLFPKLMSFESIIKGFKMQACLLASLFSFIDVDIYLALRIWVFSALIIKYFMGIRACTPLSPIFNHNLFVHFCFVVQSRLFIPSFLWNFPSIRSLAEPHFHLNLGVQRIGPKDAVKCRWQRIIETYSFLTGKKKKKKSVF